MYSRTAEVSIDPRQRDTFLDLVNREFMPLLQRQASVPSVVQFHRFHASLQVQLPPSISMYSHHCQW